jgi:subtilisin family serine protease
MPRFLIALTLAVGLSAFGGMRADAQSKTAIFVQTQPTAASQAIGTDLPSPETAAAALIKKAQQDGSVRVIAELKSPAPAGRVATDGQSTVELAAIARAQNAALARVLNGRTSGTVRRYQFIPFIALTVEPEQLKRLLSDRDIISVEEDILFSPAAVQWNIAKIKAPPVWRLGAKGAGYAVAILDTGVQKDHPDFGGRVVSEACYSSNDPRGMQSFCPNGKDSSIAKNSGRNCPIAIDGCEHGTHVAGIAAGYSEQSQGVAIDSKLIAIQIASKVTKSALCEGGEAPCVTTTTADQIAALERVYALRKTYKIAAVNMSLGEKKFRETCDTQEPALTRIITLLRKAGIATIAAAGNEYYTGAINSPACISTAIAVGSTSRQDAVSDFSNYAPKVALMAPGEDIFSSVPRNKYAPESGTSMSVPHVVGAFAALKQAMPNASVDQVLKALTDTGVPVARGKLTRPRIDVLGAYNALTGAPKTAAP